jgi:hypothetical protein
VSQCAPVPPVHRPSVRTGDARQVVCCAPYPLPGCASRPKEPLQGRVPGVGTALPRSENKGDYEEVAWRENRGANWRVGRFGSDLETTAGREKSGRWDRAAGEMHSMCEAKVCACGESNSGNTTQTRKKGKGKPR